MSKGMSYSPLDDVGDSTSKHLEALRHLEGHHLRLVFPNVMYGFVDLKRIV